MEVIITKRIPIEFADNNQSITPIDIKALKEEHKDTLNLDEESLSITVSDGFVYISIKGTHKGPKRRGSAATLVSVTPK